MILIRGAVPGHKGAFIKVTDSVKKRGIIKDLSKINIDNVIAKNSKSSSNKKDSVDVDKTLKNDQGKEEKPSISESNDSKTVKEN